MRADAKFEQAHAIRRPRGNRFGVGLRPVWVWGCSIGLWLGAVASWAAEVSPGSVEAPPARPADPPSTNEPPAAPVSPAAVAEALASSNLLHPTEKPVLPAPRKDPRLDPRFQIDTARQLRRNQDFGGASRMLITLLEDALPAELQRAALFELALVAQDENQLTRAQQILAQYLKLFPEDPTVPEVLLRQGLIFRQLGAHQLALAKYYAVMNSALNLKLEQFDYYKRLVLQAQTEIADTYYLQGKFAEASDFFGRILKQDTPELNRARVQFKLIRCLAELGKHAEVIAQAEKFFESNPEAQETPELRFMCANALKQLGRSAEALVHVIKLLEGQEAAAQTNGESWVYWQQRAGNEIANQLYLEGDYLHALQIYDHLAGLDSSLAWQLPVQYQLGLIYERLNQPEKATAAYTAILSREKELMAAGAEPSLKTILDMARFRKDHLAWQGRTQVAVQNLHLGPPPPSFSKVPTPLPPASHE